MVSGGLGWTDYGKKEVIGGASLEFFERVGSKYGVPIEWHFEPHVAEAVFKELVAEASVQVFFRHRLREKTGVDEGGHARHARDDGERRGLRGEDLRRRQLRRRPDGAGRRVTTRAAARRSSQYGESLAGVRDRTPKHQFQVQITPHDAQGRLLPEITAATRAADGAADARCRPTTSASA